MSGSELSTCIAYFKSSQNDLLLKEILIFVLLRDEIRVLERVRSKNKIKSHAMLFPICPTQKPRTPSQHCSTVP